MSAAIEEKRERLLGDIFDRLDAIERRVGLGKYAPYQSQPYPKGLSEAQRFHGERVEARQKEYSTGNRRYPREEDCEDNDEGA